MRLYLETPVIRELNYTKTKSWIHRVDTVRLSAFLQEFKDDCTAVIERPMVNPGRFKATVSAIRALEATLIVLEGNCIPYSYIDSKEWQKGLLPAGVEGDELKVASDSVCKRLFPGVHIKNRGGGDSLLIAEFTRRKNSGAK